MIKQMLKVYNGKEGGSFITFSEIPDEISLCLNITGCKCNCEGCSEPWLKKEEGIELNSDVLDNYIKENPDITCVCLMGGDHEQEDIKRISSYIKKKSSLKIAFYSGKDEINLELIPYLDYYKIGRWIIPKGDSSKYHLSNNGPINFPWSNQLLFKVEDNKLINITCKFRNKPLGNLKRYIVEERVE